MGEDERYSKRECHRIDPYGANLEQINTQVVPPSESLLASLPSGRDVFEVETYQVPRLDEDVLSRMRAPPEPVERESGQDDSDSEVESEIPRDPVGAFPGTKDEYTKPSTYY